MSEQVEVIMFFTVFAVALPVTAWRVKRNRSGDPVLDTMLAIMLAGLVAAAGVLTVITYGLILLPIVTGGVVYWYMQ